MNRTLRLLLFSCSLSLLLSTRGFCACGQTSCTITNLPAYNSSGYQVYGLNQAGKVTGFFYIAGSHPPHAFVYDGGALTDLGTFGGTVSEAFAINNAGQIVGEASRATGKMHPFLYSGGTLIDLGTLGGATGSAAAINDAGEVVGQSTTVGEAATVAFFYAGGGLTNLGTLGGNYSSAFALNNLGVVVGESSLTNGSTHGFVWVNGALGDLGTLGGDYSSAFALSDSGTVVGESSLSSGDTHGFVYSKGVLTDLGTFGGTYSTAYGINTNDQVIGIANIPNDQSNHGFIFEAGAVTDLGTLGGTDSYAAGINNLGQVVGGALTADGTQHAFLWQKGKLVDLNTILPANSGWELNGAQFINDSGRIVGFGTYNGLSQWFIMDPASANNPPVAVAGPDVTADCQAQVTLNGLSSTDPDGDALSFEWNMGGTVLSTNSSFSAVFPLGTNLVTLKVTDPCGASAQTNVFVRVTDTAPPTGSCPADVTIATDANCQARVPNLLSQMVAQDNCTPSESLIFAQDPMPGAIVGLGRHTITFTVTDASGNAASCSVLCTVVDNQPPTILTMPPPITLSAGANCQAPVPNILSQILAQDNCTPRESLILAQDPAPGTPVGLGPHAITFTVTDASGNKASGNVLCTVIDNQAPTILSMPSPITLSSGANCQAPVPNILSQLIAQDNCTPRESLILAQDPAPGTLVGLGQHTIIFTITDASGNKASGNVLCTVTDNQPPTILSMPSPITISADANCQGTVPNVLPNVVAIDNCTAANQLVMTQSPAAGTLLPSGQYTINVAVTDASQNTASGSVPLTIADTTPPAIQLITANPNVLSPPNHQLVPVTVCVMASDSCDRAPVSKIVSITCDEPTTPDEIQITGPLTASLAASKNRSGTTRTYSITVQTADASGNATAGTVTVTVPSGNGNGNSTPSLKANHK